MRKRIVVMGAICGLLTGGIAQAEQAAQPDAATAAPTEQVEAQVSPNLPADTAGFVAAMNEQITSLGRTPTCDEQTGRCRYSFQAAGSRHEVQLWYSGSSHSIYIFVNHLAEATVDNPATPVLLRHLAAASWIMRLARFEWNAANGEVRVSIVQNVDTAFDRRAFRGLLRFIEGAVSRYQPEITQILADHESAPEAPAPSEASEPSEVADQHGYLNAIEEELRALGLNPSCDAARGRCTYDFDSQAASNVFNVVVAYDSRDNTVTTSIDRFLIATPQNPRSARLLQRLLELNWQQLVPMYQWNSSTNQVRLAAVINTDSNFDRRAFRGVVQAVHAAGERNYRALRSMLNP